MRSTRKKDRRPLLGIGASALLLSTIVYIFSAPYDNQDHPKPSMAQTQPSPGTVGAVSSSNPQTPAFQTNANALRPVSIDGSSRRRQGNSARGQNELLRPAELIPRDTAPPLEVERQKSEPNGTQERGPVKIVTGFECSTPLGIEQVAPTHFVVTLERGGSSDWFMFRVEGAKGKVVRIDIKDAPLKRWRTLNPVYSYVSSVNELAAFTVQHSRQLKEPERALNGPLLPDTSAQQWHHISQVWRENQTFCFVQRYEEDAAYIAMRCPYTVTYNEQYVASLSRRPDVKVIEVGKSKAGRRLVAVQVGSGDIEKVPCVVIYGREHPDEQDTSWAIKGAIDWLTGDTPDAKELRNRLTLIAIPILDPDGAATGIHDNLMHSFAVRQETPESTAYGEFVAEWTGKGGRIDLVINLHNVASSEGPHLFRFMASPDSDAYRYDQSLFSIVRNTAAGALDIRPGVSNRAEPLARFAWWVSCYFGAQQVFYELNSQAPGRHLTLAETCGIGKLLVDSVGKFFRSEEGASLTTAVDLRMAERRSRWEKHPTLTQKMNRVRAEILCKYLSTEELSEDKLPKELLISNE